MTATRRRRRSTHARAGSSSSTTPRSTASCSPGCCAGSATSRSRRRTAARRSTGCATPAQPPIDVILLDIVMPVMDGYETLAALADDPALRHLPVIVISGVDELDSVVRCLEMGAADYLPKTVDPAILQARIASSLARKRLHDAEREAVDRQAATNEVLAIMSRSAFDLQVVLDAVVRAAVRLCGADYGVAYVLDGDAYRVAASAGGTPSSTRGSASHPIRPGRDSVVGRVALIGEAIRVDDVLADREYLATPGQQVERLPDAARRADRSRTARSAACSP